MGESIAIIALSGRFPGATTVEAFWANLKNGVESTTCFSEEALRASGIPCEVISDANYVPVRAVLDDVFLFDAEFFGMRPREAELTDPQHRLFLEVCWEAFERAGYNPETAGAVGVYAGASLNTYLLHHIGSDPEKIKALTRAYQIGEFPTLLGNDEDYLATRVAYKFDLNGPAMTIQTACSTSLVAICQAAQSLLNYQCDMALAGGASLSFPQERGYAYTEGGMGSRDGHCKAFDAQSSGVIFGSGVGVVLMKRLSEAVADGDTILAVLRGYGVNNDGAQKASYTAPSAKRQGEVIATAHAFAGITADEISYVEAHGTGTPLGDPIEIEGLTQAFRETTDKTQFCAIGTAKTNIGHLEAASGVAGTIKTILALQHRLLPPTVHFTAPNPHIPFENSPFYVNAKLSEWSAPVGTTRKAGVSSFGVGGTNAHIVLEEAPVLTPSPSREDTITFALSARTDSALTQMAQNLATHLEEQEEQSAQDPPCALSDVAHTLLHGRKLFEHRGFIVARTPAEAIQKLRTGLVRKKEEKKERPVAFLFPGQGSQKHRMGSDLYANEPCFKEHVDSCAQILVPYLNTDIREIMFAEGDARLNQTQFTQPALFVFSYALAKTYESRGIVPQAMLGHSLGEYVAATLAGVFSLTDALRLVALRARLMQALPPGAMLAVRLPEADILPLLPPELSLAAVNGPHSVVISGPSDVIATFQASLEAHSVGTKPLNTSHAFHSAMTDPILDLFRSAVAGVTRNTPAIPYLANVTGNWITAAEATDPDYWVNHLRHGVRFSDNVTHLAQSGDFVFLEVGVGTTLTSLSKQTLGTTYSHPTLASLPLWEEAEGDPQPSETYLLQTALGTLWQQGVSLTHWEGESIPHRRVTLPTYPFERKHYWVPPQIISTVQTTTNITQTEIMTMSATPSVVLNTDTSHTMPTRARAERLQEEIKSLFAEESGIDISLLDENAEFLALGFDSLFLTQSVSLIQKKFKVKVTFRQLLHDYPTVSALAGFMDAQMPPDPVVTVAAPSGVSNVPSVVTATTASSGGDFVESVVQQQMEIMRQQLALLRGENSPAPTLTAARPVAPTLEVATSEPVKQHGPFKPINTTSNKSELTLEQEAALQAFIASYTAKTPQSKALTVEARPHLADPRAVAGFRTFWKEMVYPIVAERAQGSKIWDIDGNEYVDLTMGFGTNLFGHSPRFITDALHRQVDAGIEVGPQSKIAGRVAKLVCEMTNNERVTFCNTGSEAVLAAMRIARTVTGRDLIVLFEGDYHGTFDEVLVKAGKRQGELASFAIAPGIPRASLENIVVLEYGADASLDWIRANGETLAAVLLEPVQSRNPGLQPAEFLREIRHITEQCGAAMISDEVINGFRCHQGGAQAYFGYQADMVTYGRWGFLPEKPPT
jgi:acyl transferase domain-containing protein